MKTILNLLIVLLLCTVESCISRNGPDGLTTGIAKRLMASDSGKIWMLNEVKIDGEISDLRNCKFQNFYFFSALDEIDTVFYIGSDTICNTLEQDTIRNLSWQVVGNIAQQFSDSIKLIESDTNIFEFRKIRSITSTNINWVYTRNDTLIEESLIWLNEEK